MINPLSISSWHLGCARLPGDFSIVGGVHVYADHTLRDAPDYRDRFEFVLRQRSLMLRKVLRSCGCSSAPPSHISSPSQGLYIDMGMVMMGFWEYPLSRNREACRFDLLDRYVAEPEVSAPHYFNPGMIAPRPTCVRSEKVLTRYSSRLPSCSPVVLQASGLRSQDHRCGSPQPPAHP